MASLLCLERQARAPPGHNHGGLALWGYDAVLKHPQRRPVAVEGADVDVGFSGPDAMGLAARRQIGVDQRSDILVAAITLVPERGELVQDMARHLEGAPDPLRGGALLLDLDLHHAVVLVENNGIEELGLFHRKEQERQLVIRQAAEAVLGKPDRVWKTDQDRLVRRDERRRPEDCVAQSDRVGLNDEQGGRGFVAGCVIFEDVGLARADDETDLVDAGAHHPAHQIFADRAWALRLPVDPAADRQQFLREAERLDAAAASGRGHDAQHQTASFIGSRT
jgi:hypothetical protein